jgi:hypothetical protein
MYHKYASAQAETRAIPKHNIRMPTKPPSFPLRVLPFFVVIRSTTNPLPEIDKHLRSNASFNPSCDIVKLCYRDTVKNITVTVDDETYRQARIKAAERDTSISALVKRFLVGLINGTEGDVNTEFARLAAEEQRLRERLFSAGKGLRAADNLPREALHDRHALR